MPKITWQSGLTSTSINDIVQQLIEASPDAIVVVDTRGAILLANEQAGTLFGYTLEELVRLSIEQLMPERFHTVHTMHRENYNTTPRPRMMGTDIDLTGQRKDGTEFAIDISLQPLTIEGQVIIASYIRPRES